MLEGGKGRFRELGSFFKMINTIGFMRNEKTNVKRLENRKESRETLNPRRKNYCPGPRLQCLDDPIGVILVSTKRQNL